MAARKVFVVVLGGVALAGCDPLPKPIYTEYTPPAAYRTEAGGVRVDNEGYQLDAQGYRVNKRGERIGMVDVQAKTAGDASNAVAGYWISSTGAPAPGSVATPSEGAGGGATFPGVGEIGVCCGMVAGVGRVEFMMLPGPPPELSLGVATLPGAGAPVELIQ